MAAYIISIRGTPRQAALLGLSATVGHTIVVWVLAVAALLVGQTLIAEQAEPWLTLLSGVLVTLLALRMFLRLRVGSHDHKHHQRGYRVVTIHLMWFRCSDQTYCRGPSPPLR
jgi:nickel/cobalt exporter